MKKTIHCIIDARNTKATQIELIGPGISEVIKNTDTQVHSQVILPFIEKALQKHELSVESLMDIEVRIDSGSYTGRRVAMVIAKMLGMLLHIPVNGMPAESVIDIPYEEDKWK